MDRTIEAKGIKTDIFTSNNNFRPGLITDDRPQRDYVIGANKIIGWSFTS